MNTPNCEIIRGEVSVAGGAGGLSYFSNGSPNGGMRTGASWADAPGNAINRIRNGKRRACEAMEDLIVWLKWWRLERLKRLRSKIHESKPLNGPASLKREPRACRQYSVGVWQRNRNSNFCYSRPHSDYNLSRRVGRRPMTSAAASDELSASAHLLASVSALE